MYVCGRFGEWRRAIPDNPTATLRWQSGFSDLDVAYSIPTQHYALCRCHCNLSSIRESGERWRRQVVVERCGTWRVTPSCAPCFTLPLL